MEGREKNKRTNCQNAENAVTIKMEAQIEVEDEEAGEGERERERERKKNSLHTNQRLTN